MTPSTARFQAALLTSHTSIYTVTVAGQTLPLNTGSVTADRTASVRRSCTVTVVDPFGTLVPTGTTDLLSPFGAEAIISRGIQYADGTKELIPLGVFRIGKVSTEDTPGGLTVSFDGYDRSRAVQRQQFTDVTTIGAGTNIGNAIQAIINPRLPNVVYNMATTSVVTPAVIQYPPGADPWAEAIKLAESVGFTLYFDVKGVCVCRPQIDPVTLAPSLALDEKFAASNMTKLIRGISDETAYNHVILTAENSANAAPIMVQSYDQRPNSATRLNGPYGDVPRFVQSSLITTQAGAQSASDAILLDQLGNYEIAIADIIPNAALDVEDVVTITRSRSRLDHVRFSIDVINTPLVYQGTQAITMRRVNA